jgi:nickel transport protein
MKYTKALCLSLFILIMASTLIFPASAHRVYLQEQVNEIQIRAWYGGGDPMGNAEIMVYAIKDGEEELYLEGTTDEKGYYYFSPKLGVSEYRVTVSQMGHQKELLLDLEREGDALEGNSEDAELPITASIIAGFGYIAGIAGIAMILKTRKTQT